MQMSVIYLPNGARVETDLTWIQTNESSGNLSLHSNDETKTFYGVITPQGVCHFTRSFTHRYYAPEIHSINKAAELVTVNVRDIRPGVLRELKIKLQKFNSKTYRWRD